MRHSLRMGVAAVVAGALSTLAGCGKEDLREASPAAVTHQQAAKTRRGDFSGLSGKQAQQAWDTFVADVRKGAWKDPKGQYVSDDTWVQDDGKSPRPHRPKFEPEARGLQAGTGEVSTNTIPINPCEPDLPCGGGSGPAYPTFVSSEGRAAYSSTGNFAGDILDLKIAKAFNSTDVRALDGYTILPLSLNYGAGGKPST